jgi:hypothetical protein
MPLIFEEATSTAMVPSKTLLVSTKSTECEPPKLLAICEKADADKKISENAIMQS